MALVAKGGQESTRQQAGGELTAPRPEYATGTVHHDALLDDGTVVHHHQVFDRGRLVEWLADDEPGPWALVRDGDPFRPCPKGVVGVDRLDSARLRLGTEELVLPPSDEMGIERWDELPTIPDATARLRFELLHTPLGGMRMEIRYEDGKRPLSYVVDDWVDTVEGEPAHGAPEMHIAMTWRNYLRMRSGELTALEAIEDGGTVDARWTLLLMLHGLLQEDAYIAIYRDLPVVPAELGWWGEVAPWVGERDAFDRRD